MRWGMHEWCPQLPCRFVQQFWKSNPAFWWCGDPCINLFEKSAGKDLISRWLDGRIGRCCIRTQCCCPLDRNSCSANQPTDIRSSDWLTRRRSLVVEQWRPFGKRKICGCNSLRDRWEGQTNNWPRSMNGLEYYVLTRIESWRIRKLVRAASRQVWKWLISY
jgi:hypothetical protein